MGAVMCKGKSKQKSLFVEIVRKSFKNWWNTTESES